MLCYTTGLNGKIFFCVFFFLTFIYASRHLFGRSHLDILPGGFVGARYSPHGNVRVPAASFVRHGNVLLIKGSDDDDAVPSASDIDQILQHAVPAPETTHRQQKKGDTAVDDGATLDWLGNAEHLYKLQPSSSRGGGGLDGLSLDSATPKGRNNVIPAAMPAMPTAPQKIGVWWPNYNKVYPADVVKVHANGSCLVQYHDGTLETIAEEWRFVAAGIT